MIFSKGSIKKGNIVSIVKYKESKYNIFKGYIGEVKDQSDSYLTVLLYATNYPVKIFIHRDHVELL